MELLETLKNLLGITTSQYDFILIVFALWFFVYFSKQLFALFGVMLHWK